MNVLQHSHTSQIIITISTNHKLSITIADNGNGINMDKLRQLGNGLKIWLAEWKTLVVLFK